MTLEQQETLIEFFKEMLTDQGLWFEVYYDAPWSDETMLKKVIAFSKSTRRSNNELNYALLGGGQMIFLDDVDINEFKLVTNFVN
mgnify:FL=1